MHGVESPKNNTTNKNKSLRFAHKDLLNVIIKNKLLFTQDFLLPYKNQKK